MEMEKLTIVDSNSKWPTSGRNQNANRRIENKINKFILHASPSSKPPTMLSLRLIRNTLFPYNYKAASSILHAHGSLSLSRAFAFSSDSIAEEAKGRMADVGAPAKEEFLPAGLRRESMPKHVAVIADGNARWARQKGLPSLSGHEAGIQTFREFIELCYKWGIRVLTVYAFSQDNWNRSKVSRFNFF